MLRFNANLYRIASVCVSKEETRFYLQGVLVEPHAVKGVVLTATDGHRLICIHDENGTADESAIIRLSPEASKACKTGKNEDRREIVVDGLNATINAVEKLGGEETISTVAISAKCRIDGSFPDYARVIPTPVFGEKETAPGGFNGQYLADFTKIAIELEKGENKSSRGTGTIRLLSSNPGSPALIRFCSSEHAFGVLMPVRAKETFTVPAWFGEKAKVQAPE